MVTRERNMTLPVASEAKPNLPLNWYQDLASTRLVSRVAHLMAGKQETGNQVAGNFLQENDIFLGNFLVFSKYIVHVHTYSTSINKVLMS